MNTNKTIVYGFLAIILTLAFAACPADTDPSDDDPYNGTETPGSGNENNGSTHFTVTNAEQWEAALAAISNGGNGSSRTIENNKSYTITVNGDIPVSPKNSYSFGTVSNITVTINGNGRLYLAWRGYLIRVGNEQILIIDSPNLSLEGLTSGKNGSSYDNSTDPVIIVDDGGTLELRNGTITGNSTGGVYVHSGSFTMNNGTISGNGGGVSFRGSGGNFTMNGGTINGNGGYGVFFSRSGGNFTMNGGTINGNGGGGVSVNGSGGNYFSMGNFTMNGGTISGNGGGGVEVGAKGTFIMMGGEISGNLSSGVFSDSVIHEMVKDNDGTIHDVVYAGTIRIVTGTVYGSNEGALSNTARLGNDRQPPGYTFGAALLVPTDIPPNYQYGTFSIPGDITSEWISVGDLSTTNNTIRVVNGVLQ